MNMRGKKAGRWDLLVILLILQGVGAIYGGGTMVIDPSGELLGTDTSILKNWPVDSFLIPGIILLLVLGVLPLVVASGMIKRWNWALAEKLNLFPALHWSWAFSLYIGFALIIWINVQMYVLSGVGIVHLGYVALGLAIQAVAVLPGVQKNYSK
ncbi:MAG: hypothetical protein K0R57_2864 [Paenibacillaceae bacterium]|jgi:hypothetical protein|nr:hypothetical protein [Paenibacillaceae bacterium]